MDVQPKKTLWEQKGFSRAIPIFKMLGMDMHIIDISTKQKDAVLEVQKRCPMIELMKRKGMESKFNPCECTCDLDMKSSIEAFKHQNWEVERLCAIREGSTCCVFKYQRSQRFDIEDLADSVKAK